MNNRFNSSDKTYFIKGYCKGVEKIKYKMTMEWSGPAVLKFPAHLKKLATKSNIILKIKSTVSGCGFSK